MSAVTELAAQEGITRSAAYRRLHPERRREYQRRDNAKRPDRDRHDHDTCPECGATKCADRHSTICLQCRHRVQREQRTARDRQIQILWGQGLSLREIAFELGTTKNGLCVEMHWMRQNGWELPKRYKTIDGKRVPN